MGFETTVYACTENCGGLPGSRAARYACLGLVFAASLTGGILLVLAFPNAACETDEITTLSGNAVGLAALLFVSACCTCCTTVCYWYDARQFVYETSTQSQGDVLSPSSKRGEEIYAGVDIGAQVCSFLSSCWQFCVVLSCFGIGVALVSAQRAVQGAISEDDTAVVSGGGGGGNDNTSSAVVIDRPCDNDLLLSMGWLAIALPLLFFATMVWRLCRTPPQLDVFKDRLMANAGGGSSGGGEGGGRIGRRGSGKSSATTPVGDDDVASAQINVELSAAP